MKEHLFNPHRSLRAAGLCTLLLLFFFRVWQSSAGDDFLINNGDASTGTTSVLITLFPTDPANILSVEIRNVGDVETTYPNPPMAPLTIPWSLGATTQGKKNVQVHFTYILGGGSTQLQHIFYSPIVSTQVATSGSSNVGVYPRGIPTEYPGQNLMGESRSATSTPNTGHSIELRR